MLYKITNYGNSRDVFVNGIKFYFSKDSIVKTTNFDLMAAATKMPYFQVKELKKRKKYKRLKKHLSDEHKQKISEANKKTARTEAFREKMRNIRLATLASKKAEAEKIKISENENELQNNK